MAPGSGRSCANTAAVPDVRLIETTLAGGTVVREMVCAGLSEHRTRAACSALEFTKGCVGVQPGPRIFLPLSQDWYSGRKERLRSNPQTMDRDSNRSCRLTRHKRRRNHSPANHPHRPGLGGSALPDPPRFIAFAPIPERHQQKRDAPSVLLRRPVSGLGTWRGARVASPRGPVLRSGR